MGREVTDWVESQAKGARYVEVPRGEKREEPIVVTVGAGDVADTGVMVRAGAEATVVVAAGAGEGHEDGSGGATSVREAGGRALRRA